MTILRSEIHEQLDVAQDIETQFMEELDSRLIARYGSHLQLMHSQVECCLHDHFGELSTDSQATICLAHHHRLQFPLSFAGNQPRKADNSSAHISYPDMLGTYLIQMLIKMATWVRAANA